MDIKQKITDLVEDANIPDKLGDVSLGSLGFSEINADGSNRKFYRVTSKGKPCFMAVAPASGGDQDLAESQSTWQIGVHLASKGLPVPEIYGWQKESGLVIFEDLGDTKLFDKMKPIGKGQGTAETTEQKKFYLETVKVLVALQVEGSDGFDSSWCWDTRRYDQELMVTRESMYFLNSLWHDMLGGEIEDSIKDEFLEIARLADCGQDFFLHRDYQSRNVMIKDGNIRIIDFQGGRFGPLGYDLASLLIDPYVALSGAFQEELVYSYTEILRSEYGVDTAIFINSFPYLALQRNLQILGAFSFLYKKRNKKFFAQFIAPSLKMLQERLCHPQFSPFICLRKCVDSAVELTRSLSENALFP